jgi:hypothetical protein
MRRNRMRRCPVLLVAIAAVGSACGQGSGTFAASHTPTGPKTVFVAVGGYGLAGYAVSGPAQDWAQLFYGQALSHRSTLYDVSSSTGPYVETLLNSEVSQALGLHPGLVAVSVGMPDLLAGVSAVTFEQDLEQVLGGLDRDHIRALVSNLLPLYLFPGYRNCEARPSVCGLFGGALPDQAQLESAVTGYDQAIREAASQARATLVNVNSDFTERLDSSGGSGATAFVDSSDLGLTEAGQQLVADAFKTAYSSG